MFEAIQVVVPKVNDMFCKTVLLAVFYVDAYEISVIIRTFSFIRTTSGETIISAGFM